MKPWTPTSSTTLTTTSVVRHLLLVASSPDASSTQAAAADARVRLENAARSIDGATALAELFCDDAHGLDLAPRALAGILLKNAVRADVAGIATSLEAAAARNALWARLPPLLRHPARLVRSTAGLALAALAVRARAVDAVLDALIAAAESGGGDALGADGATLCLLHLAEDASGALLAPGESGRPPLARLVPLWIRLLAHPDSTIRARSLDSLAWFLPTMPPTLAVCVPAYLEGLSALTTDPDPRVRARVCQALSIMFEYDRPALEPVLDNVVGFCLRAATAAPDGDDDRDDVWGLRREAVEFFSSVCVNDPVSAPDVLARCLPALVPALVAECAYSRRDIEELADEMGVDAHVPDRPEQLRPGGVAMNDGDDDPGDGDDDDGAPDDLLGRASWTLRKASGRALRNISQTVSPRILAPLALPAIENALRSSEWTAREGALMALGAVCEGLADPLRGSLATLVPHLLQQCESPHALVRKIACWTLSRFAAALRGPDERSDLPNARLFDAAVGTLLARLGDENKGVQFAALSALIVFIEEASRSRLAALLSEIGRALSQPASRLQLHNLGVLYEAMGALFEAVGRARIVELAPLAPTTTALWDRFRAECDAANPNLVSLCWAVQSLLRLGRDGALPPAYPTAVCVSVVGLVERPVRVFEDAATRRHDDGSAAESLFQMLEHTTEIDVAPVVAALGLGESAVDALGPSTSDPNVAAAAASLVDSACRLANALSPAVQASYAVAEELVEACVGILGSCAERAPRVLLLEASPTRLADSALVATAAAATRSPMISSKPPTVLSRALWATNELIKLMLFSETSSGPAVVEHPRAGLEATTWRAVVECASLCARLVRDFGGEVWANDVCQSAALLLARLALTQRRALDDVVRDLTTREDENGGAVLPQWTRVLGMPSRLGGADLIDAYAGWSRLALAAPSHQLEPGYLASACAKGRSELGANCPPALAAALSTLVERAVASLSST